MPGGAVSCESPRALTPHAPLSTTSFGCVEPSSLRLWSASAWLHNAQLNAELMSCGRSAFLLVNVPVCGSPSLSRVASLILSPLFTWIVDWHDDVTEPSQK